MIRDNQSRRVRQGAVVLALSLPFIVSGALSLGAAPPAGGSEDRAWNFGDAKGVSTPETGSQIRDRIDRARGEIAEAGVGEDAANESVQSVAMDLSEARGQLEAILDASPAVRIKGHIFAAAQAIPTGDPDSVIEQIGSAQEELASAPAWPSVEKTREHVEAARQQLTDGDAEAAFASLQAADGQVVLGSRDRNAAETYYLVSLALAALVHQDTTVALQALEAAQQSAEAYVTAVTPAQAAQRAS